jgi:uncharacterized repeat protein (TIGR01451 family)
LTVLHSFTGGTDGATPVAGVIRDAAGNFYGTTSRGGGGTGCGISGGCGTLFKLDTTGKETVLHRFTGATDGALPFADLVRDVAGNLYGTTQFGGANNKGVVFKLTLIIGADLSLTSSPSPNPVAHGANLTYTYAVTNKGPDNSDGDTLTSTIPSSTTFQGFSTTAGTCSHPPLNGTGTFTCSRGSLLLAGHSRGPITLTVKVNAASGTTVTNTAKVTAKTQDVNTANNTATVRVNVHWNGSTWTKLSPPVSPPGRRFGTQGMVYDAATHSVVLFGGVSITSAIVAFGDTWVWHGTTRTWTRQFPSGQSVRAASSNGLR